MWGAVIGDIVGSVYEFNPVKREDFGPLFAPGVTFTDDTVCTMACLDWFRHGGDPAHVLRRWCRAYPGRGYGDRFHQWVHDEAMGPYSSFGNGAAMRVAPIAFCSARLEDALSRTEIFTAITHNHPEGLRGAKAVVETIWHARQGLETDALRECIQQNHGYHLDQQVSVIRENYGFDESCQGTVPQAITCALEADGFEDAIRKAVSLGGDSDTLACIAGSIAEARFGIPEKLKRQAAAYLPREIISMLMAAYGKE